MDIQSINEMRLWEHLLEKLSDKKERIEFVASTIARQDRSMVDILVSQGVIVVETYFTKPLRVSLSAETLMRLISK